MISCGQSENGNEIRQTVSSHSFYIAPDDVQHGDELFCTYPACNEGQGVKFCYCVYCKAPVAKRNFRIR
jgi:hypothetical protein